MEDRSLLFNFIRTNSNFSDSKISEIVQYFEKKYIGKNIKFLSAGKICNEYLFLENGYMRSYILDAKGCDVTTNFFHKHQTVFDASSFFTRTASSENIEALSEVHGWVLDYSLIEKLFHSMPEFREFGRLMLVKESCRLKDRLLSVLTETAVERYHRLIQENPGIFQNTSLKVIASYLGITDSSLSRIRKIAMK